MIIILKRCWASYDSVECQYEYLRSVSVREIYCDCERLLGLYSCLIVNLKVSYASVHETYYECESLFTVSIRKA